MLKFNQNFLYLRVPSLYIVVKIEFATAIDIRTFHNLAFNLNSLQVAYYCTSGEEPEYDFIIIERTMENYFTVNQHLSIKLETFKSILKNLRGLVNKNRLYIKRYNDKIKEYETMLDIVSKMERQDRSSYKRNCLKYISRAHKQKLHNLKIKASLKSTEYIHNKNHFIGLILNKLLKNGMVEHFEANWKEDKQLQESS